MPRRVGLVVALAVVAVGGAAICCRTVRVEAA